MAEKRSAEDLLYRTLMIATLAVLAAVFFFHAVPAAGAAFSLPCFFRSITGLYCPGCGGTRAVRLLLQGHILQSFYEHPFVLYAVILYAVFMGSQTLSRLSGGKVRGMKVRDRYAVAAFLIIVMNWIVKNIMMLAAGRDILL